MIEAIDLEVTPPGADRPAARGVSLRTRPGEWITLVGENGGGKTSLLLALAGLWPVSAGTLTLDGTPFGPGHREGAASRVAVILQDPSSQLLQPSVGEELAFTARNLGTPEDEVGRQVARWRAALGLDVDPALDPTTLSAGRQQLVLLVAAMVSRPRLLLADEPTAHLDAATRERVLAAIAAEVAAGLAVVWATQDPVEMAAAGRTVVVGGSPTAIGGPAAKGGGGAGPHPDRPRSVALRLEISPSVPERGPRIQVGGPMDIAVMDRGVTALIGPNGAGKSVLLAAAAGLEASPQVRVTGASALMLPPIMALQYPELQVFEDLVADELVFAAVARGRGREESLAAAGNQLRYIGLDDQRMLIRRTWSLSTGEKRLVEVVGALIAPAGLVILDEPTAGLDPARREGLGDLVRERAGHGPVLVASQDIGWLEGVGATCFQLGF